jgi:hypothetical protein
MQRRLGALADFSKFILFFSLKVAHLFYGRRFGGGERVKPQKISDFEARTFVYWLYGDIAWLV